MKLPFKIVLLNVIGVFLLALLTERNISSEFFLWLAIIGFFGGCFDIVLGLFLLFLDDKRFAQGFLISGGVLILLGFFTCSTASMY